MSQPRRTSSRRRLEGVGVLGDADFGVELACPHGEHRFELARGTQAEERLATFLGRWNRALTGVAIKEAVDGLAR